MALACSFRPRGRVALAATPCPSRQHPRASPVPTPGRSSHPFQDIPFLSPTYFCPFALSRVSDSAPAWRVLRPALGAALVSLKCLFCPMLRGVLAGEGGRGAAPWPPLGVGLPWPAVRGELFPGVIRPSALLPLQISPPPFCSFPEGCPLVHLSFLGIHREACICGLLDFISSGKLNFLKCCVLSLPGTARGSLRSCTPSWVSCTWAHGAQPSRCAFHFTSCLLCPRGRPTQPLGL